MSLYVTLWTLFCLIKTYAWPPVFYGLIIGKEERAKSAKRAKKMRDASEFENEEEFGIIGNENLEDKILERPSVVKVSEMNTIAWFILKSTIGKKSEKKEQSKRQKTSNTKL